MTAAALGPAEIASLSLACSGAVVLATIVRRHRAGRPLLQPFEGPFRPERPRRLLGLALFVFVAGQLGGMLLVGGGTAAGIVGAILALAAAGYAVRLAAVLRPRGTLRWRVGMGLLHVWAALPLVYATYILALWTGLPEQPSVLAIRERETGWTMLAVAAALVAPVTEEVCFRGLVYPALRASLPVRQAILFTSLAFALVHPPAVWLPMAIFGMFLAWVVETTSSVAPAIAAHMAFNVYNVAMLVLV